MALTKIYTTRLLHVSGQFQHIILSSHSMPNAQSNARTQRIENRTSSPLAANSDGLKCLFKPTFGWFQDIDQ